MIILTYIEFSNIILKFYWFFQLWKKALQVKEKCVRGQGKVRQGSRISPSGVKEKCVRGQGEVHWGSRRSASAECVVFSCSTCPWPLTHFSLTPAHFSLTPDALLLDPWRTSPWPGGFIFQSWKQQKNWRNKSLKLVLETLYILKYSYALMVKN